MSMMNNVNKLKKHFIRTAWFFPLDRWAIGSAKFTYILLISRANQLGLITTIVIPIKQPGEIGPKPIIAKTEKTAKHLTCARFIREKGGDEKWLPV